MRNLLLSFIIAFSSTNGYAQNKDIINNRPLPRRGGAVVETTFNSDMNVLEISVHNNKTVVEVLAVKQGCVVNCESTSLNNDKIQINLSDDVTETYDLYVQTENEIFHIGSIETAVKPEDNNEVK